MAACNDNWAKGGKAGRVITAALVATLSVGAPVVALATTADASGDISLMFASPEGAFTNAEITGAEFSHGDSAKPVNDPADPANGVWTTEYDRNQPVKLTELTVEVLTGDTSTADLTIDATDPDDAFDVAYYKRDTKTGKATGEALTDDIVDAGNYVVKVTALEGSNYEGGVIWVPFDITQIDISDIDLRGEINSVYDAAAKDITFWLDVDSTTAGLEQIYDGDEIAVTWYRTGHDLSDEHIASEVKDAGTYRAYIEGQGNYTGSVNLNDNDVVVEPLNLSDNHVVWIPAVYSDSSTEPTLPGALYIGGTYYDASSSIVNELKAELDTDNSVSNIWSAVGQYKYEVTEATETDNIEGSYTMNAFKVGEIVSWSYDGGATSDSDEYIMKTDKGFDPTKMTAANAKGEEQHVDVTVFDSNFNKVPGNDWKLTEGTYTFVFRVNPTAPNYEFGGQKIVTVKVFRDQIDADATAAVSFEGKVVSSVETTYDGADVAPEITVVVKDEDGNALDKGDDYEVSYYNASGTQVRQMVNAGTYTLKVTSTDYKLTGTTEMTVKINPVTIGEVTSDKLETARFDWVGVANYDYLPWRENGYAVVGEGNVMGLGLHWTDEDDNIVWLVTDGLVNDVVKVTILDSEGNEVEKIVDEGAYTIKFEARNDDAKVNYVMPADLEILCVQNYTDVDEDVFNHTLYSDVRYDAYYADAAAFLNSIDVMKGYEDANGHSTGRFGSADTLKRGQVAVILYNMASHSEFVGTMPEYDPNQGYVTGFDDTDGFAYYAKAVAWCKQSGLIEGYVADNTFRPDQNITREEFATMLCNYEKAYGDYKAADESVIDKFADAGETSDWAVDDVAWAVEQGILLGNPSNELNPTDSILRAETAVMVYRYLG